MTGSGPTLDQRRAKHAWRTVQQVIGLTGKGTDGAKEKFGSEVKKLPMRIMVSGLGPALAFLEAKKEPQILLDALSEWVLKERGIGTERGIPKGRQETLLGAIVEGNSEILRRATEETLAYLQWLKRFAEAEGLGKDDAGGDEGERDA